MTNEKIRKEIRRLEADDWRRSPNARGNAQVQLAMLRRMLAEQS